jgi:hypothetical protein
MELKPAQKCLKKTLKIPVQILPILRLASFCPDHWTFEVWLVLALLAVLAT